ncbi:hypothetical protein [Rugamonas sp.]|nr:hypothetical protein [Rugamonas sp.]
MDEQDIPSGILVEPRSRLRVWEQGRGNFIFFCWSVTTGGATTSASK